ncbi:MAG TPA: hypothetical protein VHT91_28925 [Kofleriaceae bacterium]|jgi:hypothetical protein|nr:hypothetical protein [Kofleriaceae bacterium]
MDSDKTVDPDFGGGDLCGTDTTPDCPLRAVYLKRNALIYQLAGTRTDCERVRRAARRVDEYLVGVLDSAIELSRPLEHGHQEHGYQDNGYQRTT